MSCNQLPPFALLDPYSHRASSPTNVLPFERTLHSINVRYDSRHPIHANLNVVALQVTTAFAQSRSRRNNSCSAVPFVTVLLSAVWPRADEETAIISIVKREMAFLI